MGHQDLVDRYRKSGAALPARQRAELELAIWQSADEGKRAMHDMDAFLRKCLNGSGYSRNQALLGAGDLAEPLWQSIDAHIVTPRGGYEILRRARQIVKDASRSLDAAAIQEAIDEFNAGARTVTPRIPRNANAKTKTGVKKNVPDVAGSSMSKRFWGDVREQFAKYVGPALAAVDLNRRERVLREIDVEFAIFQSRVNACVSPVVNDTPSRAKIVAACETLGISKPRVGKSINLKEARRRMHTLAREYHPDHHNNDARKTVLYQRTMDAFDLLQRVTS